MAISSWIKSMFTPEGYPIAYIAWKVGKAIGLLAGRDLFLPLNNTKWLNKHFSWLMVFKTPVLTHMNISFFISFLSMTAFIYILFFIREERVISTRKMGVI